MSAIRLREDTAPLLRVIGFYVVAVAIVIAAVVLDFALRSTTSGSRTPSLAPSPIAVHAAELTTPSAAVVDVEASSPNWIWGPGETGDDDTVTFTREITFGAAPRRVALHLSCDNESTVLIDGQEIATTTEWSQPLSVDVTEHLPSPPARFTLEVRARNHGGPAGLLGYVEIVTSDGRRRRVVTDSSWRAGTEAAVVIAAYGAAPWGTLPGFGPVAIERQLEVPDGFEVELVYTVPAAEGSWVSMTTDGRGRLITSDQSGGLFRVTPSPLGASEDATQVEAIDLPVGAAQGLLCVEDDLYVMIAGNRADGQGLYRVRDLDGDDVYDDATLLWRLSGGGEHGPHAVVLGPDGLLYMTAGNHTTLPEPDRSVVPRSWGEDHLLPRLWDARGHAVGMLAPGGWIVRSDRDGGSVELFAIGFRNTYDIAFDRHGELFTYDADMEWDLGAPWYRPTRIIHVVSGADYGWRSGTGKWPSYYPDSLPATLDIGPGSPTGICFGYDTAFPDRYRNALYALDWTFGTVYAVHMEPDGATYRATHEPFLTGRPLPVADAVANPADGALYVLLGGRGVPSAIYRVRYAGDPAGALTGAPAGDLASDADAVPPRSPAMAKRRSLERLHGEGQPASALDEIWPHLASPDRFIAHAARTALEFQPVERWIDRLHSERSTAGRLSALIALVRHGDAERRAEMLDMLTGMSFAAMSVDQRLSWLRCLSLCFIRMGPPDADRAAPIRSMLETQYPTAQPRVDRELCLVLVYLDSPVVVARTLVLMEQADANDASPEEWFDRELLSRNDTYGSVILKAAAALPQQQQVALALSLRNATRGWTPELRTRYFDWFSSAKKTAGGLSFSGSLEQIRVDALALIPEEERAVYERVDTTPSFSGLARPMPIGPGRQWTIEALASLASTRLSERNFDNGRTMFDAALCGECHRVAGVGGISGPDLTAISTRFTVRDLLASIIEPSRTVSDQYEQTELLLDDDTLVLGRVIDMDAMTVTVMPTPLAPEFTRSIPRDRIVSQLPSAVSSMMPHLLDPLNEDEVLDLLAYILAEGDSRNAVFQTGD